MQDILIWVITSSEGTLFHIKNLIEGLIDNKNYKIENIIPGQECCDYELDSEIPEIILIDWEGYNADPLQCLQRFKKHELFRKIPVIIIGKAENIEKAIRENADDFIDKPINESKLKLRIELTLRLSRSLREIEEQKEKIENQTNEIEIQREVSERMLLNILPYEIAEQLKKKGTAKTKLYKRVTVMFTDFKDFSMYANNLPPKELVGELSYYFQTFDEIIDQHYIEKIKTIGDAYMCAGGLPLKNKSNPFDVLLAAMKIKKFMVEHEIPEVENINERWSCRIGIHTGEVVAGVIGKRKFAYDIWGDTVNTASRMEENGEVNKINISGPTYEFIKDYFDCTYRGKINVKNKGDVDMYFVNRIKPEYSDDEKGYYPNADFNKILSRL